MRNNMYKFIGYVLIITFFAMVPIIHTYGFCQIEGASHQASKGEVDSMVDTIMGKQELELQKSVEDQAIGDIVALRQFIIDSLQMNFDDKLQEIIDSLTKAFQ